MIYKTMPMSIARTLMKAGEGGELTETEKSELREVAEWWEANRGSTKDVFLQRRD